MIPKNLISVWMGRGEKCDIYKRCREAKERIFEGWNFIDINEDNCPILDAPFMKASQNRSNHVHLTASRLWALREYGGVYLDEDVEPLQSFDEFLDTTFFIGREQEATAYYCDAVIGSVAKGEAISRLFWSFPWGCDAEEPLVVYGPRRTSDVVNAFNDELKSKIVIHDKNVFYPYCYGEQPRMPADRSVVFAIHHWTASWLKVKE